ncbi:MAG: C39 family peptidase [Limisphaerales bacterium]
MNHHSRDGGRRAGNGLWSGWGVLGAVVWLALAAAGAGELDPRGGQFIGFTRFSAFAESAGGLPGEKTLTSPEIAARIHWDELVASWNAETPGGAYLKVEARALYPQRATRYYTLALYSGNPSRHPRQSVRNQADSDGDVATDTLILKEPCGRLQVRLTLGGDDGKPAVLKFLGLSLTDSKAAPPALPSNRAAWGKTLPVPERSQMAYSNGVVLCSPVTVSMIMSFWSRTLNRPELDLGVTEIAKAVYDPVWQGTGNWPFNTAYAGSYPGMRAYVTRLTDLAELEDWIADGLPAALSVCLNRLSGRKGPPSGHLVVCVGFTKEGDLVINDPGARRNVRKVVPRKNAISAWACSKNTVYLIYPENAKLPEDRFGHWDAGKL